MSTGTTCQLNLSYTPTGYATPGTLMVGYSYKDNAGQTKSGTVSIPYRATTNDTIAGTPSQPSLAVIIGSPTTPTPVTITFATSDGNPAIGVPSTSNALTVTSGLNPLPAGWSASSTTFSCLTVSDGTVCQLPLTYAPTAVTSGVQTLMLGYSYVNDAGLANTGTASINYRAMSNNSVQGAANPDLAHQCTQRHHRDGHGQLHHERRKSRHVAGDIRVAAPGRLELAEPPELYDGQRQRGDLSARPDLPASRARQRNSAARI